VTMPSSSIRRRESPPPCHEFELCHGRRHCAAAAASADVEERAAVAQALFGALAADEIGVCGASFPEKHFAKGEMLFAQPEVAAAKRVPLDLGFSQGELAQMRSARRPKVNAALGELEGRRHNV
jgi:hypothetical protein